MRLTFSNPQILILLVGLPLFVLLARRMLAVVPGARLALAVRLLTASLAIFALSQPILSTPSRSLAVVFAVDSSDSLDADEKARSMAWVGEAIRSAGRDDQAGVVLFGRQAAVVRPLSADPEWTPNADAPQVSGELTDVSAGLRLASSLFVPTGGKRIVLVTDGQENAGRAREEVARLATQGIQVDALPVGKIPDPEVLVESVDAQPYLREGETVDVAVTVQSSRESDGTLRLWVNGDAVLNQAIHLRAGANRFVANLGSLPRGFHAFRARIDDAPDSYAQNNEGYAYSVVKDPARVLMVAAEPTQAAPLQALLVKGGIQVDVRPPQAVPSSFAPLKQYDGMVLVDVPVTSLALDQLQTIQGFVESLGRGLFVVGGDNSYGAGGYAGTLLADLLPVEVKAPSRVETGQAAVILVVDKSGSMDQRTEDGATKIAAARDAASLAVGALSPTDYLGVLAFDTENVWVTPPRQVGDDQAREQVRAAIRSIEASGGTEVFPALQAAYEAIRQVPAQYRYVVLMSDGVSFTPGDYDGLTARMRAERVVLSTIAVGQDADKDLLSRLARLGDGHYYYTNRASDIPTLTVREAQLAAGAPKVEGEVSAQVKAPSPILRALPADLPPLRGQATATSREDAMTALASQRGDVILAHWQRGLGRVVAWTSDAGARWAGDWVARPDLAKFWSQAVRWSLPAPLTSGLHIRSQSDGNVVRLQVEAVDDGGALLNLLDLRARIGNAEQEIPLTQIAPGRYEARLTLPEAGIYAVHVAEREGGQPTDRAEVGGLVVPYPAEYRHFGPDTTFLAALATMGGGRELTQPPAAFGREGVEFASDDRRQLWPWLLAIGLLLFPLDIGIRRLRLDHTAVRPCLQAATRVLEALCLRLPKWLQL